MESILFLFNALVMFHQYLNDLVGFEGLLC